MNFDCCLDWQNNIDRVEIEVRLLGERSHTEVQSKNGARWCSMDMISSKFKLSKQDTEYVYNYTKHVFTEGGDGMKQVIFSDSVSMDKKRNLKSETRIQTHLVVWKILHWNWNRNVAFTITDWPNLNVNHRRNKTRCMEEISMYTRLWQWLYCNLISVFSIAWLQWTVFLLPKTHS